MISGLDPGTEKGASVETLVKSKSTGVEFIVMYHVGFLVVTNVPGKWKALTVAEVVRGL